MLLKCYTQYVSKFGKLSSGHGTGKCQFSFQSQRSVMPNTVHITIQLCSFHMLAKLMLKILQVRLQQYVNQERLDIQARFRKGKGTRDQIANIHWTWGNLKKKTSTSASLTTLKPLTVWITTNWKILKRDGNIRPRYLSPEKPVCRRRSNS